MKQLGFTIVELLVIIIVVGILASIVIVSYNGVQNNARDTSVQSDLDNAAGHLETYRTASSNIAQTYPDTTTKLGTVGITAAKPAYNTSLAVNFVYCTSTDLQQYAIAAVSRSGTIYLMRETGFQSHSLTTASFTASLCTGLGMTLRSNGFASSTWQSWVGNN